MESKKRNRRKPATHEKPQPTDEEKEKAIIEKAEAEVRRQEELHDLLHPYVVDVYGNHIPLPEMLQATEKVKVKAVLQDADKLHTLLHDHSDILICDLDLWDIKVVPFIQMARWLEIAHTAGLHFIQQFLVAPLRKNHGSYFSSQHLIEASMAVGVCHKAGQDMQHEIPEIFDRMVHYNNSLISLRAKVRLVGPAESDNRPLFDKKSEACHQQVLYELEPYIEINFEGRVTITYDAQVFGILPWAVRQSSYEHFFSLPTKFRKLVVSAELLAECYNRRTILAGIDSPAVCAARVRDILERSPEFDTLIGVKLATGYSVLDDTRLLALAMLTRMPWLEPKDF